MRWELMEGQRGSAVWRWGGWYLVGWRYRGACRLDDPATRDDTAACRPLTLTAFKEQNRWEARTDKYRDQNKLEARNPWEKQSQPFN